MLWGKHSEDKHSVGCVRDLNKDFGVTRAWNMEAGNEAGELR